MRSHALVALIAVILAVPVAAGQTGLIHSSIVVDAEDPPDVVRPGEAVTFPVTIAYESSTGAVGTRDREVHLHTAADVPWMGVEIDPETVTFRTDVTGGTQTREADVTVEVAQEAPAYRIGEGVVDPIVHGDNGLEAEPETSGFSFVVQPGWSGHGEVLGPGAMVLDPVDGGGYHGEGEIDVVNLANGVLIAEVSGVTAPGGVNVTFDDRRLDVGSRDGQRIETTGITVDADGTVDGVVEVTYEQRPKDRPPSSDIDLPDRNVTFRVRSVEGSATTQDLTAALHGASDLGSTILVGLLVVAGLGLQIHRRS